MPGSPHRDMSVPIQVKGYRWKHLTVQGHVAHPPKQHSPRQQDQYQTVQDHVTHPPRQQPPTQHSQTPPYQFRSVHGHISTLQQKKRHRNPSPQSGRSRRRRRVEADSPISTQSLIDAYNSRKAATALFPPKITPQHIRAAMRRYEQVIQDACANVENSCVSCGEFGSRLVAIDEDRLRSMEMKIGVRIQLDHCGIMDGSYQFCQPCLNALDGGRIPKFSAMNAVNVTMCQDYPAESRPTSGYPAKPQSSVS